MRSGECERSDEHVMTLPSGRATVGLLKGPWLTRRPHSGTAPYPLLSFVAHSACHSVSSSPFSYSSEESGQRWLGWGSVWEGHTKKQMVGEGYTF